MEYEQMEIDVTLDGERDLKENVQKVIGFAHRQIMQDGTLKAVSNKHEGYGIAAEYYVNLQKAAGSAAGDMKAMLNLLPAGESDILNTIGSLYNSAAEIATKAITLAAQAKRILDDLYYGIPQKTPIEEAIENAESEDDGFEDADNVEPEEAEPDDTITDEEEN